MQLQGLAIALRPRPSWEAVDLGMAMVRAEARAVFAPVLLLGGIAFVLLNALLLPLGLGWLAALLLWWLKPALDRVVLVVLSRTVLGQRMTLAETLAQLRHGWAPVVPWLLWRRLHPLRALLLPVDLLEGGHGARRGARVRVLASGEGPAPLLLWILGVHLELVLYLSVIVFGLMLVPTEFLSDSARALVDLLLEQPPWWLELLGNLMYWLSLSLVEPFYAGAGFALYLNRRTVLEAWDIELAFRRLAARLLRGAATALLVLGLALPAAPVRAQEHDAQPPPVPAMDKDWSGKHGVAPAWLPPAWMDGDDEALDGEREAEAAAAPEQDLVEILGGFAVERDEGFEQALQQALADPDLRPVQRVGHWKLRKQSSGTGHATTPSWMRALGNGLGFAVEYAGWILLALLLLVLLANHRRWLPSLLRRAAPARLASRPDPLQQAQSEPVPDDLGAAVLAHWRAGDARAALSLFYCGAVEALGERLGVPLPPGATEAESLRHARRLPSGPFTPLFERIVRQWQVVAWAHRRPDDAEVVALVEAWNALERGA